MNTRPLFLAACLLTTGLTAPRLYSQNFTFTTLAGGAQGAGDGQDAGAQFYNPTGVAVDAGGNLYVADQKNNLIRKISPLGTDWIVTTLAGGAQGSLDGTNLGAQFFGPTGIAIDSSGALYVADQFNGVIRRITLSGTNWIVSTLAGTAGVQGGRNGANGSASFSSPTGIAVDGSGNLFVADEVNNAIREITPSGTDWIVTTIAGGSRGSADGTNLAAQFSGPFGVAVDSGGRVFVADQFNNAIRLITPMGTNWVVTTIAGQTVAGRSDGLGTNALFDTPLGLAVDTNDNVYVADAVNNAIRKLTPSGTNWMVSTIGGGSEGTNDGTGANARFDLPFGVAADASGDVYVADSENNAIRLGVSSANPPATGSLKVLISPQSSNAISTGANWQLDGAGAFQTNGAVLSGLVPGDHTVNFNLVSGYTTPAVQTVPVTVRQTTLATGNYTVAIANAGSVQVMILPAGAVNAGAQWQVDNGVWQTNGGIAAGLSAGVHTLSFSTNAGWTTASDQVVSITNSQTTLAVGAYVLQTGSLVMTLLPSNIAVAGAKWTLDGGTPRASGATLSGLLPGSHTVSFNTVLGWKTPASQAVNITNALTTSLGATYTRPPRLSGTVAAGGGFQFVMSGPAGSNYLIQASSDLVVWTTIATNFIPAGGSIPITDWSMTNYTRRFYRALAIAVSPPELTGMTVVPGTARFVLNGQTGSVCVIQASSNLLDWSAISTNTIPDPGSMPVTDLDAGNQAGRFYRAVRQ